MAQDTGNKIAWAEDCKRPRVDSPIQVGDRPDHSMVVSQATCTVSFPIQIAGASLTAATDSSFDDISGTTSRTIGYHVGTMDDGDKLTASYQGRSTFKDNSADTSKGTWTFSNGTGKLKGIKGKGTYSCQAHGSTSTCSMDGEYTLPAAK